MTDLRKLNYYVFLWIGVLSFSFGIVTLYLLITSHNTNAAMGIRGVLGGPALTVFGAYLIYTSRKAGRDIEIVPNRENK